VVSAYRQEHGIEAVILPTVIQPQTDSEPKKTQPSGKNTKEITLELFEKGLTIQEVARERSLVNSTIEGHLAFFISEGRVKIETLLTEAKTEQIKQAISRVKGSLRDVKMALGSDCSYGEILLVQSHMNYMKNQ